jgi:hypothetical protein
VKDPGQIAYEARFSEADRKRRYHREWATVPADAREVWARVESACQSPPRPAAPDAPGHEEGDRLTSSVCPASSEPST